MVFKKLYIRTIVDSRERDRQTDRQTERGRERQRERQREAFQMFLGRLKVS